MCISAWTTIGINDQEFKVIEIYTDGACIGNPGPGGWSAILVEHGREIELLGQEEDTTNNRMELTAVIRGLANVQEASKVRILSDSQYVINTMTLKWKRKTNNDLWEKLDSVMEGKDITWEWVRGHSGNTMNERADNLARHQAEIAKLEAEKMGPLSNGDRLSHVDESGKARMVDVGAKMLTERVSEARGTVHMKEETLALIKTNRAKKGDVLATARIAGIMAAKSTSQLIPMCHPINLDNVVVELNMDEDRSTVEISAIVKTISKTGVEMEAMTAVSVAALTVYDMCKSGDRGIRIGDIRLASKMGGKSGNIVLEE